jgi:predicted molibdopterin-dependent oxidoreductase YjgC
VTFVSTLVITLLAIVKVTSPDDYDITRGNLCIKGRFGFQHVQPKSNGA